jgi:hypothetical protein
MTAAFQRLGPFLRDLAEIAALGGLRRPQNTTAAGSRRRLFLFFMRDRLPGISGDQHARVLGRFGFHAWRDSFARIGFGRFNGRRA